MKVNLGCGELPLDGYVNVDAYSDVADIKANVFELGPDQWNNLAEIRADHFLEHLSFHDGALLVSRCRHWIADDGILTVEVPDMQVILSNGPFRYWEAYVYGAQSWPDGTMHPGEFHLSGYTDESLRWLLEHNGWRVAAIEVFRSTHQNRPGMPCLKATAVAA